MKSTNFKNKDCVGSQRKLFSYESWAPTGSTHIHARGQEAMSTESLCKKSTSAQAAIYIQKQKKTHSENFRTIPLL